AVIDGTIWFANAVPNTVPTIASATEPPIWRKNVRLEVATPSMLKGTAFWTTRVKTANVGPTPRPAMNIQSQTTGIGATARSWFTSAMATAISEMAPTSSHL